MGVYISRKSHPSQFWINRNIPTARAGLEWLSFSTGRVFLAIFLLSFGLRSALLFWDMSLAHLHPEAHSEVGRVARTTLLAGVEASHWIQGDERKRLA